MDGVPWLIRQDSLGLRVRVTPRGGRDAIEGVEHLSDGSSVLKVRVRAAPEDGAANASVRKLLAKAAGVPVSAVDLATGATARIKFFTITGEPQALADRLVALTGHTP